MDILIEVSEDQFELTKNIFDSLESILEYPSRSAVLLETQAAYHSA